MNKKLLAILLILSMLFGGVPAMAEKNTVVTLSEEVAKASDMVQINLELSGNDGFANLGLEIGYDSSVMTLLSANENESIGAICTTAESMEKNPYNIGWDGVSDVTFNGILVKLIFLIAEDAPAGYYPVTVDYYKGRNGDYQDGISVNYDADENPLHLQYENGGVAILEEEPDEPGTGDDEEPENGVFVSLSSEEATAGETVDLVLSISENVGFSNLGFEISYDNSIMKLLEVRENPEVGAVFTTAQTTDKIPYNVGWDSISDNPYNGTLATFTFEISEDSIAGDYPVTIDYYKGRNGDYIDGVSVNYNEADQPLGLSYYDGCIHVNDSSESERAYHVEIIPGKDVYAIGEELEVQVWLYTDDVVVQLYEGDYTVSGFDSSKPGLYEVTVSYGDDYRTFTVEVVDNQEAEPVITHIVRAIAGAGVTISPSGYSEVKDGTVTKFALGAKEGYQISLVKVNGQKVEIPDGNLSVTVTEDTVIEVSGRRKTYSITQKTNTNGRIELSSGIVEYGGLCTARIVADDGYVISDVLVDGKSVGACRTYHFTNVQENHTIEARFEEIVRVVTVRAYANGKGRVSPARSTINAGGDLNLVVTPDYGYRAAYAEGDGKALDISNHKIMLEHIDVDTDVSVVFEKDVFPVSVVATEGVELSVCYDGQSAEQLDVPYMEPVEIVLEVADGYKLNTLYVNGVPVKATRADGVLKCQAMITGETQITARCVKNLVSEFNIEVSKAGLAAEINRENAEAKKAEFIVLAEKYALLSAEEKMVCTTSYATVLAALDRANAYIALNESGIIERINSFPDKLEAETYRMWKGDIELAYTEYEGMTNLSKSLIDYAVTTKLLRLKQEAEAFEMEHMHILEYLQELVYSVTYEDILDAERLPAAYSRLSLAESTYYGMHESEKELVSPELYNELTAKLGRISTQIQKLYIAPFTSRVLRCQGVDVADTIADAEAKRAQIYELMNEYHALPLFAKARIPEATHQRLDDLYESASIRVSATVNNVPVDVNGEFDEAVELVLTEPDLKETDISDVTGKALYQAIDVKLYTEDAQEVQPSSKIRMKMEITKELAESDISVIYIDNEGVVFDVQGEVMEENGNYYVIFFVDHFSSFAILYNEKEAPETQITFDREYVEPGDEITASVSGAVNPANCMFRMAGYSEQGALTFVKDAENGTVFGIIPDETVVIKAMLWDNNMSPLVPAKTLFVATPDIQIKFNRETISVGDEITATVTGVVNPSNYVFRMAGYSGQGKLTFVKDAENGIVSGTVAEETAVVKTFFWNQSMSPVIDSEIRFVGQ